MSSRKSQRGATVIEYAFVVALLVVPISSVVSNLQDEQGDRLEASAQRVGMPEEFASNVPASGNSNPASGSDTTTPSTAEASIAMTGTASTQGSKKWTAVVEIQIVDANSDPILDAEITGTWQRIYVDGTVTTETAHCSSNTAGDCTLSLWNLRVPPHADAIADVIFTVTALVVTDASPASGVVGSSTSISRP